MSKEVCFQLLKQSKQKLYSRNIAEITNLSMSAIQKYLRKLHEEGRIKRKFKKLMHGTKVTYVNIYWY